MTNVNACRIICLDVSIYT